MNYSEVLGAVKLGYRPHFNSTTTKEQREARRLRQEACDHPQEKHYPLTAQDYRDRPTTPYILCLDCGIQFPVEGDE